MGDIGIITLLLLLVNAVVTYRGFKDFVFYNKYLFNVGQILGNKDYKRLVTAGFLHANWVHFGFNMITLYLFSQGLEVTIGMWPFLLLYVASLVGGNLLALFIHRNHPDYSAIGASGAVSGMVFASIGLFPNLQIGFIILPFHIPAWLYGIAYVLYSIYGIKTQRDNIGHEAHLGGGVVGLLILMGMKPSIISTNFLPIALILVPSLAFLYLIVKKPHILIVNIPISTPKNTFTIEDKYNSNKESKQVELDRILDKISKKGYDSLTKQEKDRLNGLSE